MGSASERWLHICDAVVIGDGQFCLLHVDHSPDPAALGVIDSVAPFGTQLLDVDLEFGGHLGLLAGRMEQIGEPLILEDDMPSW